MTERLSKICEEFNYDEATIEYLGTMEITYNLFKKNGTMKNDYDFYEGMMRYTGISKGLYLPLKDRLLIGTGNFAREINIKLGRG